MHFTPIRKGKGAYIWVSRLIKVSVILLGGGLQSESNRDTAFYIFLTSSTYCVYNDQLGHNVNG